MSKTARQRKLELFQKAYQSLSEGPNKDVGRSLGAANLLARAKLQSAELESAYSLFSWVAEESAKLRDSNSTATLTWLGAKEGAAEALVAQKKFEVAEKELKELTRSLDQILGRDHPWTHRVKKNLAGVYQSLGKAELQGKLLGELKSVESKN